MSNQPDGPSSDPVPSTAVSRGPGFALLFVVFNIAFVMSPYWLLPEKSWQRAALLISIVTCGTAWAWYCSGAVKFGAVRRPGWFLLVAFPLLALNARAMVMGIPWMGDEGFHIGSTVALVERLLRQPLIPVGLVLIAISFVCVTRGLRSFWFRGALACAGFVFAEVILILWLRHLVPPNLPYERLGGRTSILLDRSFEDFSILRYPYLVRWGSALLVVLAAPFTHVTPPLSGYGTEAAYRLVPLLSAMTMAWIVWRHANGQRPILRWLLAMAVGTAPLLVYYSSTLYLELPAVVLMTIALFDAQRLLTEPLEELRALPAWYALITVDFVKETTIPFISIFLLFRLIGRLPALRNGHAIAAEAGTMLGAVFPLAMYIVFRNIWASSLPYVPVPGHLTLHNIGILLDSYAQQFGPLGALAVVGVGILLSRGRFLVAMFLATLFLGDAAFHLFDSIKLIGYSRFNLFLLPVVVVAAIIAIDAIPRRFVPLSALLAACVAGINLFISPLNADGSKIPNWGDYDFDEAEHYYPYREAIRWLDRYHPQDRVLVTGLDYSPSLYFYAADPSAGPRRLAEWGHFTLRMFPFDRVSNLGMRPDNNPVRVANDLSAAARDGFDVVLYHVMWGTDPSVMPQPPGWRLTTVFSTRAACLVVYERVPAV